MNIPLIIVSILYSILPQDEPTEAKWIETFRADVMAFVSGDLNSARIAEARLEDIVFEMPTLSRYATFDLSWMDMAVTTKLALKLDPHIEGNRTIYCALGLLSVCPNFDQTARDSIRSILNGSECHVGIRMAAFKTLCCKLPNNESVFGEIENLGLTFDLYDIFAIAELNQDNDVLNKYRGLAMAADDLVVHVRAAKRNELEVLAIVDHLKKCELPIEKVFCISLLLSMPEQSKLFLKEVKILQMDKNDDVRLLTTMLLINCSDDQTETDGVIKAGRLNDDQQLWLKNLLERNREIK